MLLQGRVLINFVINTKQLQAIYSSDLSLDKENSLDFLVRSNSHECERGVGLGEGRWVFGEVLNSVI